MIFTKTTLYKVLAKPIDCGKYLKDNRRIFGDNKTIIGFISMIIFNIIAQISIGIIYNKLGINSSVELYSRVENNILNNTTIGFLFGLAYVLFELPNSFIKRRIGIEPGKTNKSLVGSIFFVIDQIDSLIGIALVLIMLSNISLYKAIQYIILGAFIHVSINFILYKMKIRRNL